MRSPKLVSDGPGLFAGLFIIVSHLPFSFFRALQSNSFISSFKMKKFIFNLSIFIIAGIPIIIFICMHFKLDGYTDTSYLKFSTPRQSSLITGTSRAAQGIVPSVLNKFLNRNDMFNYAFTIGESPYGPTYLESIKNKISANTRDGIYIIAVDPWSICDTTANPNDSIQFPEISLALGEIKNVSLNPNIFYLLHYYQKPLYHLFTDDTTSGIFLHRDGWLEITIPMDSASISLRIEQKIKYYRNDNLPRYKFSAVRFNYLLKTIVFLKTHGTVYLVRLPVHPQMSKIEDELMPGFDNKINSLALNMNVSYKNFKAMSGNYQFVDGNHLYKSSAGKVSAEIAEWINGMSPTSGKYYIRQSQNYATGN